MIDFPYSNIESPSVIVTVGIPGCGKTMLASELAKALKCPIISPDNIREILLGDARDQRFNVLIWKTTKTMAEVCISAGRTVIIDAMYIEPEYRKEDAGYLRSLGAKKIIAVAFTTPLEVCLSRNAQRDRHVDPATIEVLYHYLLNHPPVEAEGFDAILRISS